MSIILSLLLQPGYLPNHAGETHLSKQEETEIATIKGQ
jgi:hypothetical protein